MKRFLTAKYLIPLGFLAAAGAAVVLIWFQPQKLFIDTKVDEKAPGAAAENAMEKDTMAKESESMEKEAMEKEAMMAFAGTFRGIDHETSGTATLDKATDGHYYVRFENFSTQNGPDLYVYLSPADATSEGKAFAEGSIDLGKLKGNIGNQNYQVPDGTDLSKYRSVVIWCRRFSTAFGAAPLDAKK